MSTPQQPELHRSGHTPADPKSAKSAVRERPGDSGSVGPVPEDNLPGHHPDVEQDKPAVRVKAPLPIGDGPGTTAERARFGFAFEPQLIPFAMAVAVTPWTSHVQVGGGRLRIRFGWWRLETSLDNVAGAQVTGPYAWWKVAGPPHVSLADRGVTFATATTRGVCIRFHQPVAAIDPLGLVKHPAATVTIDDPEALVRALTGG
jgi:hypothetical protein